ncbi:MAG: ABC transporter permease [Gammaproteobacteria bacterium]|nr:ABC transporter permease [Gammaproteobacteria bacterium]
MNFLPLRIAWRYSRAGSGFLSFVTAMAAFGLGLGTAVLVLVLSVMNGFDRELRERILGVLPHAVVHSDEGLQDWRRVGDEALRDPRVVAVAPLTRGPALLAGADRVLAVDLTGIDPDHEGDVSILPSRLTAGSLDELRPGAFGAVLGSRLAASLEAGVGDDVVLVMPDPRITLAGAFPRQKRMRIVGIFEVASDLDDTGMFVHLEDARRLLRVPGEAQGVRLRLVDLFAAGEVVDDTLLRLGDPRLRGFDWRRTHGNLYEAIGLQKRIMFVLLSLLVAVAAFNVVSMLTMVVNSKRGDIAILRTMGLRPASLVRLFFAQGGMIAAVGIGGGLLMGTLLAWALPGTMLLLQDLFDQRLLEEYFVRELPVAVIPSDLLAVAVIGLGIALLTIWWPARRALKVAPAEELRHE